MEEPLINRCWWKRDTCTFEPFLPWCCLFLQKSLSSIVSFSIQNSNPQGCPSMLLKSPEHNLIGEITDEMRKKEREEGEGAREELPGLKWWHKRGKGGGMHGWEGGMGGYLMEDCVRASSLGSISVSKYGGICYCTRPVLKTCHWPGRKLESREGRGVKKTTGVRKFKWKEDGWKMRARDSGVARHKDR